jgi:hypothetical protein
MPAGHVPPERLALAEAIAGASPFLRQVMLRDPAFAAELRRWIGEVLARIEQFIAVLSPGCPDARRIATQLFDLVQGLSTHLLFDEDCWTVEAIREALAREVALLPGL